MANELMKMREFLNKKLNYFLEKYFMMRPLSNEPIVAPTGIQPINNPKATLLSISIENMITMLSMSNVPKYTIL